jgi:two-component system, OmpR family, sensor histidine kinase ChvG
MASDTDTRRAEVGRKAARRSFRRLKPLVLSRLAALILGVNLVALVALVAGILAITENRRGLVEAKIDSLTAQANLIHILILETAVSDTPRPAMDPRLAGDVMARLYVYDDYMPASTRAFIHDLDQRAVGDSLLIAGRVRVEQLAPPYDPTVWDRLLDGLDRLRERIGAMFLSEGELEARDRNLIDEVRFAQSEGEIVAGVRRGPDGARVVSVTVPIMPIQTVVGSVTYESYDLDALIAAERRAILPYLVFAAIVILASGLGLTIHIAGPVRRLAEAAREARLAGGRRVKMPDLGRRRDEIGDMGRAFSAMTEALYDRLDAIESFAADVSHEIKNPLTSIRSAAEVLPRATDDERRDRLIKVIQHDVNRLDRLITDISNASRLDAELARDKVDTVDLGALLTDLARIYEDREHARKVHLDVIAPSRAVQVMAHEGPLTRVFTNLIDNAVTFSPEGGTVTITVGRRIEAGRALAVVAVEDEGPGIPPDNLERIFERFYTQRPAGAAFGSHSGLGLAISRQIVEAHGGTLEAGNREPPVTGARFTVTLPAGGR